jgi:hypothetical protein
MQLAVNRARVPEGHVNSVVRQFSTQHRTAASVRAADPPGNAVFTMLATLISGRLTEVEQTENNLPLSR